MSGSPLPPFLKWPGGKSRELKRLELCSQVRFSAYFEPFVGGGGALLHFDPRGGGAINDVNPDLVGLYRAAKGSHPGLRELLRAWARFWDRDLKDWLQPRLEDLAQTMDLAREDRARFQSQEAPFGSDFELPRKCFLGTGFDPELVAKSVETSLVRKMGRVVGLEAKHARRFEPELLARQLETGIRAGVYTYLRDLHDRTEPGREADAVLARFFFLRETCYGSMFRTNREGRFNIPYGGMGYNRKSFSKKVESLFSPARAEFLRGLEVESLDFRDFFARYLAGAKRSDLVFLDPPYDTQFSDYDGAHFGEKDQIDLAEWVARTPCQILGVLKATPRILALYEDAARRRDPALPPLELKTYDKTYSYNVRGRNQRQVEHLLLRAIDPLP